MKHLLLITLTLLPIADLKAQGSVSPFIEVALTVGDDLSFEAPFSLEAQLPANRTAFDFGVSASWPLAERWSLGGTGVARDLGRALFNDDVPLLLELDLQAGYQLNAATRVVAWAGALGDLGESRRSVSFYGLATGLESASGPLWGRVSVGYAHQKIEREPGDIIYYYPQGDVNAVPFPPPEFPLEAEADRWLVQLAGEVGRKLVRPFLQVGGDMRTDGGGDVRLYLSIGVRAVLAGNEPLAPSYLAFLIPEEIGRDEPVIPPPCVPQPCGPGEPCFPPCQ